MRLRVRILSYRSNFRATEKFYSFIIITERLKIELDRGVRNEKGKNLENFTTFYAFVILGDRGLY
jgi:hypothetical protein